MTQPKKILFTHSYFYRFDQKQWENQQPYPPLGTITAAAWMRQNGYEVALCDTALAKGPEVIEPFLKQGFDSLAIYDDGFNYLTKMCLTNMREAAFDMAKMAKQKGLQVFVSSSDSTDHFEKYLENGADVVILGEAEETLLELANGEKSYAEIPGIAYLENGEIKKNPKRPVMRDLDQIPMAAWDLVNINPYRDLWMEKWGYFSLNIATTRGCPFKCNWCAKPIYGNRYNTRSVQHVSNEIEYLVKNFKPTHFWMCDDIFGLKPGWVQEFRDEVKSRNLNFKYKIQSRVDLLLKEDSIEALAQSGLHEVWVGAESGSQKILDAMDKGTQLSQIEEATRILKSKGVRVAFFLQFGYLGETKEDIQKTIDMVKRLKPDDIGISVSYPLPGTKFYDMVKSQLGGKQNWTDSDDLAMMYQGTFSSAYYKKLHRFVHKEFRKAKALEALGNVLKGKANPIKKAKPILSYLYYGPTSILDKQQLKRLEAK